MIDLETHIVNAVAEISGAVQIIKQLPQDANGDNGGRDHVIEQFYDIQNYLVDEMRNIIYFTQRMENDQPHRHPTRSP